MADSPKWVAFRYGAFIEDNWKCWEPCPDELILCEHIEHLTREINVNYGKSD